MEELDINHQIVYFDPRNAKGVSMNLLSFGFRQFYSCTKIEKLGTIKQLCENFDPNVFPDPKLFSEIIFNGLLDAIKITVCFENFMKSMLLLNGGIIHKLDKNIFPDLYQEQFIRPITLAEIRQIKNWEINDKIQTTNQNFKYQIKGILKNTIGMKELTSSGYSQAMGIGQNIMTLCKPYFEYRNNIHLYMGEFLSIGKTTYTDLTTIIDFVNNNVVALQNKLVDELKKGDAYKDPFLKY